VNHYIPILAILFLSACSHTVKEQPTLGLDQEPAKRISPHYEAYGQSDGVRVYLYGEHTLISAESSIKVWGKDGEIIPLEKIGKYFRSETLLKDFHIEHGKNITHIKKIVPEKTAVLPLGKTSYYQHGATAVETTKPALEIKQYPALEGYSLQQLDNLQIMIDKLADKPSTSGAELFHAQVNQNDLRKKLNNHFPVTLVYFDLGKTTFKPTKELIDILIPAAKTASEIHLRGRTDSVVASKSDPWIAEGRAKNAKAYLINEGVDPEIITINYLPEGDFLLPPKPLSSKMINRRVEIEVRP